MFDANRPIIDSNVNSTFVRIWEISTQSLPVCEASRSSRVNRFQQVQPKLSNTIPSSFRQGKHCNLYSPASGSTLVCSYRPIDTTRFNDNWNANGSIKSSCRSSQRKKGFYPTVYQRYVRHFLNTEISSLPVYELSSSEFPNSVYSLQIIFTCIPL